MTGSYAPVEREVPAGAWRVAMTQRLARLAFYLLEPGSNDGLVTWNVLDESLKTGRSPILRTEKLSRAAVGCQRAVAVATTTDEPADIDV